jgi:hypothetical protein
MRARVLADLLTAATGLLSVHTQGAHTVEVLTPTLEFEEGPLATEPTTGGSVSAAGLTATGTLLAVLSQILVLHCPVYDRRQRL